MKDAGKDLGTPATNRSSSIVLLVLGVLLVSCAVFLSLVLEKADLEARPFVLKAMVGSGLLGVGLVAWAGRLRRR